MSTRTYRHYSMKDDKLITLANVIRDYYIKYKASFHSFNDVFFPADYEDAVLGEKLVRAQATTSDAFVVKSQVKETTDVQKAIKALLRPMKILTFIVETHFAHDPVIRNEFMLDKLSAKAQNVDTLIGFTKDVITCVEKYHDALTQGGLKPDLTAIISQACEELDRQRRDQIDAIRSRPKITLDRVEKMNELWNELVKINKAANVIFEDHPEVCKLFELPHASRQSSLKEQEDVGEELQAG